jgi:N-acetylglucosaminyl-diphospho-decaprenol L-rhamnosyltransferase
VGLMPGSSVTVDAVVVAYNSRETLRACVAPLAELPWVAVTVVDNASPDDSAAAVADLPVRVIRAPQNGGFAYGCNLGLADATAEFVLLLNPDARIDADSLSSLVDALRAESRVAGVGPRTLDDAGRLVWSQRRFPRLRSTYAQAVFLQRVLPMASWTDEVIRDPDAYARPGAPDWISGACLLLRREALDPIGGLDEGFFLYSEDTDLFRRLRSAGWEVRYEPRATARHRGGASAPRHTTERIAARSRVRYARKHQGATVAMLEACGVLIGALTHAVAWLHRPARARGHAAAARAALVAVRSSERAW